MSTTVRSAATRARRRHRVARPFHRRATVAGSRGDSPLRPGHRCDARAARAWRAPPKRRRRSRPREARSRLGRDAAAATRARAVPVQGAARGARDELAALITLEHGKVLSDARGEVIRGHRSGRVRLRHSAAAARRVHRERRHRRSTAGRCASRSASAPASRRSIFRRWCRCGCSRWRSRAATRSC